MIRRYPELDPRRATQLYEELARVASKHLSEWQGVGDEGEFGDALWRIAGRLGEHVTRKMDQTPLRDKVAFFEMLDVPAEAARPATVPLVFLMAEQGRTVSAPAGIQVAAKTDDGEEILFETTSALQLTPARVTTLVASDGAGDTIYEAPHGFVDLAPALTLPAFETVTFAGAGGVNLQIDPYEGLGENDLIRIDGTVYRIESVSDGLFKLKDELAANVAAGTSVEKVVQFDAFALRNVQAHAVYIGHLELLNVEGEATITVSFEPESVAERLGDVAWTLYGTREDDGLTDWQPLTVTDASSGTVTLAKDWTGAVEETEVDGLKNRWLRARYATPIADEKLAGTSTRSVGIGVRTGDATGASTGTSAADCGGCGGSSTASTAPGATASDSSSTSAVQTISQAFHNASPLPLTTPFLPFGPEPQRFDTFSLAAPEAFSKKGALVTLDLRLPDATILGMDAALVTSGAPRIYAIGRNGSLQVIVFDEDDDVHWKALAQPQVADAATDENEVKAEDLTFLAEPEPQAAQVAGSESDLVVALDRRGRVWASQITLQGTADEFEAGAWNELTAFPGDVGPRDLVLLRNSASSPFAAILLAVVDGALQQTDLTIDGAEITAGSWLATSPDPPAAQPAFGPKTRLVPVLGRGWPQAPGALPTQVVVLDDGGTVWLGKLNVDAGTIAWSALNDPDVLSATGDVKPAAAALSGGNTAVFAAYDDNGARTPFVAFDDQDPLVPAGAIDLAEGSAIKCLPSALGDATRALSFGMVNGVPHFALSDEAETMTFQIPANVGVLHPPDGVPSGCLLTLNGAPTVVLGGTAETLHRNRLAKVVETEFFTALELPAPALAAVQYVKLELDDEERAVYRVLDDANGTVDDPVIDTGTEVFYKAPVDTALEAGDLKLFEVEAAFTDGTAVAVGPLVLLTLDVADTASYSVDDFLIIADTLMKVVGVSGNNLGLDRPLPTTGGSVPYERVVDSGETLTFDETHRGTLLQLTSPGVTPGPSMHLHFRAGGTEPVPAPTDQNIEAQASEGSDEWVKVEAAWTVAPGASTQVELVGVEIARWSSIVYDRGHQNPKLSWEYYTGDGWRRLEERFVDGTDDLAHSGEIRFQVPDDLAPGEVAGQEDYWIRARLVGGDYGRAKYIVESKTVDETTTQSVTIDTTALEPPEILRIHATFDAAQGDPQQVIVANNLTYRNQTDASRAPDAEFELFEGVRRINGDGAQRVLYLCFSGAFDLPLSMFVDAVDQELEVDVDFEVLTVEGWRRVTSDDATAGFHRRGFVTVSGSVEPHEVTLFGRRSSYWMRVRPSASDANWAPRLRSLFVNVTVARQAETIGQELLGSSAGEPALRLPLSRSPVLHGSLELRVRETLSDEEVETLTANDRGDERTVTDYPALSLTGHWVLWKAVDSFIGQSPDARVYRLDAERGQVEFGEQTKTPPAGTDNIRAIGYQTGGGTRGNIDAFALEGLKSAVDGVEKVANPVAASGGSDTPVDPAAQITGAPDTIRRGGQALTPPDVESLLVSTSPDVIRARCLLPETGTDPIRVAVVLRRGDERIPEPTLAELRGLESQLRAAAWGALPEDGIKVVGPEYVRMKIHVRLRATSGDVAAALEIAAAAKLRALLHPITGGPRGDGWAFAQRIWKSDVLRAVAGIEGLDAVEALPTFETADKGVDLEHLAPFSVICAEEDDVEVSVELGDGGPA